ncbi:cupredoxin domain-containing protein [Desulfurispirillum indicum]|uniref:Cytochrome c oxidase subunit II n=1 Tax=Desulfurispirillum indicum (strain ATCC BAA-1389 / DSM 22839 / S5) TaxID=653733 RepID=E6W0Y2_DESIS|nr:cupredoxin domain-containing protein [Desulfurispirillum indicum]ADU65314.1 cytochrome c oxidase subunit II [Desulfurispirillum indicum S5]UCZ57210.1 cupredoxin domain-containing protein [Desulfurispirillum indicum]
MKSYREILAAAAIALMVIGIPIGVTLAKNIGQPPHTIDLIIRTVENGGYSPSRIVVKQGEPVRLRLISEDVTHGLIIGELGIDAGVIQPGKMKTIEFTPERKGEFGFVCSVICSPLHTRLRGTLVVE